MKKELKIALFIFATIFIIDQVVKFGFASLGWGATGSFMNLELAYNYGVAFSMLEFFAGYLKYIQLSIVVLGTIYLIKNRDVFYKYYIPIALLYAGGLSNILDRFTYGAVVDYFAWHSISLLEIVSAGKNLKVLFPDLRTITPNSKAVFIKLAKVSASFTLNPLIRPNPT